MVCNTKSLEVNILNAFTDDLSGGNPAGVVFDADDLSEKQMLAIAKAVGFSETAFVMKVTGKEKADFRIRYFTPEDEVDVCGHATVATLKHMLETHHIKSEIDYVIETKAGYLKGFADSRGHVFLEQALPVYSNSEELCKNNFEQVINSLNCSEADLLKTPLPCVVSTGLRDILVGIKSRDCLNRLSPNWDKMIEVSETLDVVGFHVFTFENQYGGIAQVRNFAPRFGILEESATDTSNAALACYLYKTGCVSSEQVEQLSFEQGYAETMLRPSKILVSLVVDPNHKSVKRVVVGGSAIFAQQVLYTF